MLRVLLGAEVCAALTGPGVLVDSLVPVLLVAPLEPIPPVLLDEAVCGAAASRTVASGCIVPVLPVVPLDPMPPVLLLDEAGCGVVASRVLVYSCTRAFQLVARVFADVSMVGRSGVLVLRGLQSTFICRSGRRALSPLPGEPALMFDEVLA